MPALGRHDGGNTPVRVTGTRPLEFKSLYLMLDGVCGPASLTSAGRNELGDAWGSVVEEIFVSHEWQLNKESGKLVPRASPSLETNFALIVSFYEEGRWRDPDDCW